MKNYFDVAGKYAVVTGASSGLGRQFALCLAEQGCNVAIAARRVERLEEVKKEVEAYGVKCLVLPCDVTDTEQIRNSVDKVVKEFGRIDILITPAASQAVGAPVVSACWLISTQPSEIRASAASFSRSKLAQLLVYLTSMVADGRLC